LKKTLKFIDLFAGLGGFHLALNNLGHQCVFASELDKELREIYALNHKVLQTKNKDGHHNNIIGDIHNINIKQIPEHDILCAGFPCQPFSQAGKRNGLNDPINGNHFFKIIEILKYHKPTYVFLENVATLKGHDDGKTWGTIKIELKKLKYDVTQEVLSPHQFGIPQHRKRLYIVGKLNGLKQFRFPMPKSDLNLNIYNFLSGVTLKEVKIISKKTKDHLKAWQNFLDILTKNNIKVPRFPIWATEFGATYPYKQKATTRFDRKYLVGTKGVFQHTLSGDNLDEICRFLPKYALTNQDVFPNWKQSYINKNREFYIQNKTVLKPWLKQIIKFDLSHQKFEWNCGYVPLEMKDKIIQFRPSGIRIKSPNFSPALVLVGTQTPILFDKEINDFRYINYQEAALLQKMDTLKTLPIASTAKYKALGNAVNVEVVRLIAKNLLQNVK